MTPQSEKLRCDLCGTIGAHYCAGQADPSGPSHYRSTPAPSPSIHVAANMHTKVEKVYRSEAGDAIENLCKELDAMPDWEAMFTAECERSKKLESENAELKRLLTTGGTAEIASRNVNIASYSKEWEQRAEAAEAACVEMKEHLTRCMYWNEAPERASEPEWERIAEMIQGHTISATITAKTPQPMPPELVEEIVSALQFLAPIISYYERVKPLEGNFDSAQPAINWDGNSITLGDLFKAKEAITKIQAWRGR